MSISAAIIGVAVGGVSGLAATVAGVVSGYLLHPKPRETVDSDATTYAVVSMGCAIVLSAACAVTCGVLGYQGDEYGDLMVTRALPAVAVLSGLIIYNVKRVFS